MTAGGPPPPPPPPPPGLFSDIEPVGKSEPTGVNALFADINKGDDVTKGKLGRAKIIASFDKAPFHLLNSEILYPIG